MCKLSSLSYTFHFFNVHTSDEVKKIRGHEMLFLRIKLHKKCFGGFSEKFSQEFEMKYSSEIMRGQLSIHGPGV